MIVGTIGASLFVNVTSHLSVLIPSPVVGGIVHASLVEQILVVEHDPVVCTERQCILLTVGQTHIAAVHAGVLGHIRAVRLDVLIHGDDQAFLGPVLHVGKLLHAVQIRGVAAGQHGAGLHVVVLRCQVHPLDGHIGVGCFVAFLNGGVVRGAADVPSSNLQGRFCHCRCHGGNHHRGKQASNQFLHRDFLLVTCFGDVLAMLPFTLPIFSGFMFPAHCCFSPCCLHYTVASYRSQALFGFFLPIIFIIFANRCHCLEIPSLLPITFFLHFSVLSSIIRQKEVVTHGKEDYHL